MRISDWSSDVCSSDLHTVVGEMGFYRGVPRTASVIAEEPTVIYRLTRTAFDRMQEKDPAAAAALHKLIIRLLSDRLEFANREISAQIGREACREEVWQYV